MSIGTTDPLPPQLHPCKREFAGTEFVLWPSQLAFRLFDPSLGLRLSSILMERHVFIRP